MSPYPPVFCRHLVNVVDCEDPDCRETRGRLVDVLLRKIQDEAWSDRRPVEQKALRARERARERRALEALR